MASKGKFPMNTLLGSMNFLVPGRPAVWRRWLLSSISWDDLEERERLREGETFMRSLVDWERAEGREQRCGMEYVVRRMMM